MFKYLFFLFLGKPHYIHQKWLSFPWVLYEFSYEHLSKLYFRKFKGIYHKSNPKIVNVGVKRMEKLDNMQ